MSKSSFARQARVFASTCGLLLAVAAGCSKNAEPEIADLGEVKGNVTYNGKPVVLGAVQFFKSGTLTCVAVIQKDGTYQTVLVPGEFTVAIVPMIEPREAAKWAKDGPPDMVGVQGGRMPERKAPEGKELKKKSDPFDRLPTLASALAALSPSDRSDLEAVQKRYAKPAESGLKVTVVKGDNTHDFNLK
jgi:hypothetical protein